MTTKIVSLSATVVTSIANQFGGKEFNADKLIASINAGLGRMQKDGNTAPKLNAGTFSPKTGFVKFTETNGTEYVSDDISVRFLVWHNEQVKMLKKFGSISADAIIPAPTCFHAFLEKHVGKSAPVEPETVAA